MPRFHTAELLTVAVLVITSAAKYSMTASAGTKRTPACGDRRAETAVLEREIVRLERARMPEKRCDALRALARNRAADDATVALITRYAQPPYDHDVRGCAVRALGRLPNAAALAPLLEFAGQVAFSDSSLLHWDLGMEIAAALAAREEDAARSALRSYAHDIHSPLRVRAAIELSDLSEPDSIQLLADMTRQVEPNAVYPLFAAIGRSRDPGALGILVIALDDPDWAFMGPAIDAIGALGTPESIRTLRQLMQQSPDLSERVLRALIADSSADVRGMMVRALRGKNIEQAAIAASYFERHPDPRMARDLIKLALKRSAAIAALAAIGPPVGFAALEELARTPGEHHSEAVAVLSQQPGGEARVLEIGRTLLRRGAYDFELGLSILASHPSPEARAALMGVARGAGPYADYALDLIEQRGGPE